MKRQQKDNIIASLAQRFQESPAAFVVDYKGLDVSQMSDLRQALRQKSGVCKVAKVTLIKRSIDQVPAVHELQPFIKEQIALVFAQDEPALIAKVLHEFAKEHERLQVIAGCLEEQLLDAQAVSVLAKLPSKEVLFGQVCGSLQAPARGIAIASTLVIKKLLIAIKQVAEKQAK